MIVLLDPSPTSWVLLLIVALLMIASLWTGLIFYLERTWTASHPLKETRAQPLAPLAACLGFAFYSALFLLVTAARLHASGLSTPSTYAYLGVSLTLFLAMIVLIPRFHKILASAGHHRLHVAFIRREQRTAIAGLAAPSLRRLDGPATRSGDNEQVTPPPVDRASDRDASSLIRRFGPFLAAVVGGVVVGSRVTRERRH